MQRLARLLCLVCSVAALGCLIPDQGTPVWVDSRAGKWWDGRGKLLEVSDDQTRCRVAVRDRALLVQDRWVDCRSVHPRRG